MHCVLCKEQLRNDATVCPNCHSKLYYGPSFLTVISSAILSSLISYMIITEVISDVKIQNMLIFLISMICGLVVFLKKRNNYICIKNGYYSNIIKNIVYGIIFLWIVSIVINYNTITKMYRDYVHEHNQNYEQDLSKIPYYHGFPNNY